MPRKLRQLRAELRRAAFAIATTEGSHETWRHASGRKIVLAGHDGADAQPYQERQVRAAVLAAQVAEQAARKDKP